jgi:broad-specificity NMP kinase
MLVVVCGRPCVGKTSVAFALAAFLEAQGKTVIVINEESLGIKHADGYKSQSTDWVWLATVTTEASVCLPIRSAKSGSYDPVLVEISGGAQD